ncbi:DUF6922 domain-containing protein [Chitinophaga sedimenti]|uniref:DUF6922 domain-containing protein n=1 Tax=Chitinophaga sedimenti TaxID=2033606 RepID=UPI0035585309
MQESSNIAKPNLTRRAFWDIDLKKLDFDRYSDFTIIRTMERGTKNDIREIIRYYGAEKVRTTLVNSDRLMPRALIISRRLFHLHNSDYKCSTAKPRAMNYSKY